MADALAGVSAGMIAILPNFPFPSALSDFGLGIDPPLGRARAILLNATYAARGEAAAYRTEDAANSLET